MDGRERFISRITRGGAGSHAKSGGHPESQNKSEHNRIGPVIDDALNIMQASLRSKPRWNASRPDDTFFFGMKATSGPHGFVQTTMAFWGERSIDMLSHRPNQVCERDAELPDPDGQKFGEKIEAT